MGRSTVEGHPLRAAGSRDVAEPGAITLEDKYVVDEGRVYLSGIQALVRLPLMQAARDAADGLDTAGYVSGYRGSPLAGLDQQLTRARAHLESRRIRFEPGLNEELAATAVWGSQQLGLHRGAHHEGVFGMWYGKAPGVDRASDALRHANAAGTAPRGGVLAICGDDHACKSSSYPTQSETLLSHLEMPVLSPSNVQDVLDYGLLGWALSRFAGTWVGLIALADVMDSSAVVEVGRSRVPVTLPPGVALPPGGFHIRGHDDPREQEERLRDFKIPAAMAFARASAINRVEIECPTPRLVLVTTGKSTCDTRQALDDLGIDAKAAAAIGVRLVKVGMPWPLDPVAMRGFCAGAEKIFVIEEKRPLVESQLKEVFYELPDSERPRIVGKRDDHGAVLLSDIGDLDAAQIGRALARQLPAGTSTERLDDFQAQLASGLASEPTPASEVKRIPFFCSGCPHNRSTVVPAGSRALVGIGCHYMVQWMDRSSDQFCQMGGEGAAWLGQRAFTEEEHIFANLGDGTYLHSGILAIRAAVAAGARITYKLLYNHAVAMTGGQSVDDMLSVSKLTRQLAAEGVARIVVVAEEPERVRGDADLAAGVRVEPREQLDRVQRELREIDGVTVLIYDQGCAAEKRRLRKRGRIEDPARRVFINERVCEGCGDCSTVSNCLSVEPVSTELGLKRRINQSSCNKDFSCLEGSCPALVTIHGGEPRRREPVDLGSALERLPAPNVSSAARHEGVTNIVLAGIGGTGVTTAAALLGMAAHIEGRASGVLDMTGLAQKGGAVVSHVRLADTPAAIHGTRVPGHAADLLLAADPLVAASAPVLEVLDRGRTISVVNGHFTPTAASIGRGEAPPELSGFIDRIEAVSRRLRSVDATRYAEAVLGDAIGANLFLLGHALQAGLLPLRLESLVRAIELNGVAVEMNLRAFALGRLAAFDEKRLDELCQLDADPAPPDLDTFVARRERDLVAYQNAELASRYRGWVERAREVERARVPGSERFAWAVARFAYKLLAVKDEYEVARLYTAPLGDEAVDFETHVARVFEGNPRIVLALSPPLFARRDPETGRLRKRAYGSWIFPIMRLLARLKGLRGTPLDVFGWLPERRLERRLAAEFLETLDELMRDLAPRNHELACRIAEIPDAIRGFDRVKLESARAAALEREALLARFRDGVETAD